MERPSLSLALASVVAASLDGDPRRLLSHLRPRTASEAPAAVPATGLASVSTLPRVIPMQRRHTESMPESLVRHSTFEPGYDPEFDPSAA